MKQFRITTENLVSSSLDDCVLDSADPIHQIKAAHFLDGLGADYRLAQIAQANALAAPLVVTENKAQIMREQNIKPGTDEWFKLWFSNSLTSR